MSILYSLSKKSVGGEMLYFANTRSNEVVDMNALCSKIARHCTLKKPILQAAVAALSEALKEELAMGNIVDLGEIGRFRVSCGSKGVKSPENFNGNKCMKDAKIVFRPGKELKRMLMMLQYKRVAVR